MSSPCLIETQPVAVRRRNDCLAVIHRIFFYLVWKNFPARFFVYGSCSLSLDSIRPKNKKSEPFSYRKKVRIFLIWWARVDSNHRSIKQQIYSLSPLATREHAHILFYRAGVLPGDLFILPQALLFVNSFFKLFRSSAPGCRSDRQRAAGPYPVVQPAAPDCLLILAPAGAFVNREFAFWGGIVVS